ncbi:uncharacterized protein LOC118502500 [Anopheles stephensi]|uniref:uncharacterized protein LOC118502500 n=1 Tax=Anopheles stephensi TaxID=30069 RepID=UPI001658C27D|nr:uncharacterized protein LOC118502500 [Anopheles stephensi]
MENLQVMLVLARLAGFNCYLYHETQDGFVSTFSRSGFCLFVANLVAYVYFAIANVLNLKIYTYTGSVIVDTAGKVIIELGYFDFIIIALDRLYQYHWTTELLNGLRSIDKELDAIDARRPRAYRNSEQLFQMVLLMFCIFCAIAYSVYVIEGGIEILNLPMYISHQMLGVTLGIVTSTFYAEVYELRLRLNDINNHIRNTICDANFHNLRPAYGRRIINITNKNDTNLRKNLVARLALMYDELHSISTKISNRYKFVGKKTASLISIAMSQETEKQCIQKMHSFLCQIQHNSIKITTYIFDVNMIAFFGIFSTIMTYLFILLQFTG